MCIGEVLIPRQFRDCGGNRSDKAVFKTGESLIVFGTRSEIYSVHRIDGLVKKMFLNVVAIINSCDMFGCSAKVINHIKDLIIVPTTKLIKSS